MRKLLLVYNPVSGKQMIHKNLGSIVEQIESCGYEVTIRATEGRDDAYRMTREITDEYERVIVGGGDGTLHEAMKGMKGKKIPLGYIPTGSTNDFGHSLLIRGSLEELVDIALSDSTIDCDVGKLNEKPFIYVACFGTLSNVSYTTSQQLKNVLGHAAYVLEGFRSFRGIEGFEMTVSYDDQVITDEFGFGMISNSRYVAGLRMNFARDVRLDDGKLEVFLIRKPHGPITFGKTAIDMIVPQEEPEMIVPVQTSSIHFHSDEPVDWGLDGEFGGSYTDVDISVDKGAVRIVHGDKEEPKFVQALDEIVKTPF